MYSQLAVHGQKFSNNRQLSYSSECSAQPRLDLSIHNCITDALLFSQHHSDGDDAVRHLDSTDHLTKSLLGLEPIYIPRDPSCDMMTSNNSVGNLPQVVANSDHTLLGFNQR